MIVSVILCTFDRSLNLVKTLESVAASRLPESIRWEVLVVDNNSSDGTREVVESFCLRYPGRFRYVFEPHPGKSHALNAGIREARGDVLAFVDDDVTVEPSWLGNLTAGLDTGVWAGTGGRTLPADPFSPPRWLSVEGPLSLGAVLFAQFDLGDKARELDQAPFGNNMAFRRKMFEQYGGFRTDLGPSPSREIPRPNEDTEFGRRLMAAGERLRYEPSAVVYHPILTDRLEKRYFLTWFFDFGRAVIREFGANGEVWGIHSWAYVLPDAWQFVSIPKLIVITLPRGLWRWVLALEPSTRFFYKCYLRVLAGQIFECYYQWRRGGHQAVKPNPVAAFEEDRA